MKLHELNEKVKIVNKSDLDMFSNWDARFWIDMDDYIDTVKKEGVETAITLVSKTIKKIGEENYITLKNLADKEKFGVPEFNKAIDTKHLKSIDASKIVILMDLVDRRAKIRKSKLESELKKIQKQIDMLG